MAIDKQKTTADNKGDLENILGGILDPNVDTKDLLDNYPDKVKLQGNQEKHKDEDLKPQNLPTDWERKLEDLKIAKKELDKTTKKYGEVLDSYNKLVEESDKLKAERDKWTNTFKGLTADQVKEKYNEPKATGLTPEQTKRINEYPDLLKENTRLLNVDADLIKVNNDITTLRAELDAEKKKKTPVATPTTAIPGVGHKHYEIWEELCHLLTNPTLTKNYENFTYWATRLNSDDRAAINAYFYQVTVNVKWLETKMRLTYMD